MLLTKNLFLVEPHLSESKQGEEFSYREDRKKPSTESVDEDSPECVCVVVYKSSKLSDDGTNYQVENEARDERSSEEKRFQSTKRHRQHTHRGLT
jgi:hypothetical protein